MCDETWTPPVDPYLSTLGPCANCGEDFYRHNADTEPPHMCPPECQEFSSCYGFFHGGDPRNFHPDYECCSEAEIENHKKACEEADRLESARDLPCPSGWIRSDDGSVSIHVLRSPFGIGIITYPPTCYEPETGAE